MAFRAQTYDIAARHSDLGLERATAHNACQEQVLVDELAQRGFQHLWTIRTRHYRLGGFLQVKVRSDLGPLGER